MEHKLRLKDHKGGWHNMPLEQLFKLLIDEVKELEEAVTEGNTFDIMAESADVGNYAMMIMDNAIRRITNEQAKTEVRSEEIGQLARDAVAAVREIRHESKYCVVCGSHAHGTKRDKDGRAFCGKPIGCAVCGETHGCGHDFTEYHGRPPADAAELGEFWQRTRKSTASPPDDSEPIANFPTECGG